MRMIFQKSFEKRYKKLPQKIKEKVKERNLLFEKNPFDPLLNNHTLHGKLTGMRSIDITGDYRAVFIENSGIAIFIFVGTHSELYGK